MSFVSQLFTTDSPHSRWSDLLLSILEHIIPWLKMLLKTPTILRHSVLSTLPCLSKPFLWLLGSHQLHRRFLQISSSSHLPQGCSTIYFLCPDLHILSAIPSESHSMMTQPKLFIQSLLPSLYLNSLHSTIAIWFNPVFQFIHQSDSFPWNYVPYLFYSSLEQYLVHSNFTIRINEWLCELRTLYLRGDEYYIYI